MTALRDYQSKLVGDIHAAYAGGARSVLSVMATGGGKTVVMAHITDAVQRKGNVPAIIAHRQELVMQTSLSLAKCGVQHRVIAPSAQVNAIAKQHWRELGGVYLDGNAPAAVASVQTLARRPNERFDFLMPDEAHHAVAGSWRKVIDANAGAFILGKTATPERLDGKGLGRDAGGPFDVLVEGPQTAELVERGYLSPASTFAPIDGAVGEAIAQMRTVRGDFDKKEAADAVDQARIVGDVIAHYRRICDRVPAIAFCISIDHARHVEAAFAAAGYRARCVDGTMSDHERRAAILGLGEGKVDVLTSCEIVNEGTDVPVVGAAILLRPTKSLGLFLQQCGRVLRTAPGKDRAFILDHVGNTLRHGLVTDPREWSLAGRKKRAKADRDDGPIVRTCKQCFAISPGGARVCPACGTEFEVEAREIKTIDGELQEVTPEVASLLKFEKMRAERAAINARKREQGRADNLDQLIELGRRRGMKNPEGWARHVMNGRRSKEGMPTL